MKILLLLIALIAITLAACSGEASPDCPLICDINMETFVVDVSCESGPATRTRNDSTEVEYDPNGQISKMIVELDQQITYLETDNTYVILGTMVIDNKQGVVTYDIDATGGQYGNKRQNCISQ